MYGPVRTVVWEGRSREAPPYPDWRYGPAGDSAPQLRLKAAGMTERFPFGPASTARNPPCGVLIWRIAIYGYLTISNEIQNHWLICIPLFPRPP